MNAKQRWVIIAACGAIAAALAVVALVVGLQGIEVVSWLAGIASLVVAVIGPFVARRGSTTDTGPSHPARVRTRLRHGRRAPRGASGGDTAMTGVEVVLAALVAGAGAGATAAVAHAYTELGDLLRARLAGRGRPLEVLSNPPADAATLAEQLGRDLEESGAGRDQAVLDAARRLLAAADPAGIRAGKYVVDVREAKGVQVGDSNVQHNTFS